MDVLQAKLLDYKDIGQKVRHFVFEVPEVEQLQFKPGQFVSLTDELNGKKVTRAYSLASPQDGNRFELCLNRVDLGTFSPYLFALKPGEEVPMTGPHGTFTLREPVRDSIFVATGTGIAPFRSMLLDWRIWEAGKQYTLILGVRHDDGVLYREDFESLERQNPNFRFWPVVSRPSVDWDGRTGYVQSYALEAAGDRRDLHIYICGLKEMVNDVRRQFKEIGFRRKSLIYEKYD